MNRTVKTLTLALAVLGSATSYSIAATWVDTGVTATAQFNVLAPTSLTLAWQPGTSTACIKGQSTDCDIGKFVVTNSGAAALAAGDVGIAPAQANQSLTAATATEMPVVFVNKTTPTDKVSAYAQLGSDWSPVSGTHVLASKAQLAASGKLNLPFKVHSADLTSAVVGQYEATMIIQQKVN
ncbi:hypothetical protein DX244_25470 [Salmonella enterica]|nr:hypothetical protein [Salmonella enterica]